MTRIRTAIIVLLCAAAFCHPEIAVAQQAIARAGVSTYTSISVGTSTGVSIASTSNRIGFSILNTSTADDVSISFQAGTSCTYATGTDRIAAGAAKTYFGPTVWQGSICAIRASSATTTNPLVATQLY